MSDPLTSLRDMLQRLIAAIGGHRGSGTGGGGGGVTSVLTSIVLTGPTSAVASHAAATAYTAIGYDQKGAIFPFTPTFNSSVSTIATIASSGVAQAVAAGTTSITAVGVNSLGTTITSTAITLTVAARQVTTVQVFGNTSVIATHTTPAYTAQAFDQLGTFMGGQTYSFASSTPAAATIDSSTGIATGIAVGNTSITATAGGVTSATPITLQVFVQVANSVSVSPASFSVAVGSTQALAATVMDQGTPANVITGASAAWSSGTPSIATVSSAGLVTGVANGAVTITATFGGKSGTSAGTITAGAASSISAAPSSVSGGPGTTRQLTITTNTGTDVTSQCTFTSNAPTTAYADYTPVLTSVTPSSLVQGSTNQTVTLSGSGFTSAALGQAVVFSSTSGITVNSTTFTNSTTITLNLTIAANATAGSRTIQVTDGGHGNSAAVAFAISATPTAPNPVTSGLVLNLRADAGTSTTTNGAPVSSWTDQSATGTIYSQATSSAQPLYLTAIQNGLPVLRFDGVNDVLSAPGAVSALAIPNLVLFAVFRRVSGGSDGLAFTNLNGTTAGVAIGQYSSGIEMIYGTGSTATPITATGAGTDTSFHQSTYILNQAATNKQEIRVDGTSRATAVDTYSGSTTAAPSLGGSAALGALYGNFDVAELLVYNPATNPNILTTDLPTVESYLKSKWGTP